MSEIAFEQINFQTLLETNTPEMEQVAQADNISIHRVEIKEMQFIPVTYYVLDLLKGQIFGSAPTLNSAFEVAIIKVKERMNIKEVVNKSRQY